MRVITNHIYYLLLHRFLTTERNLYKYWEYATESHVGWPDSKLIRVRELRMLPYKVFGPQISGIVVWQSIN